MLRRLPRSLVSIPLFLCAVPGLAQVERAKLVASDGGSWQAFGSVAIEGETLLVGASAAPASGEGSGAAYVFERVNGAWVETAKLVPADGTEYAGFGSQVALDGSRAVISAPEALGASPRAGALYVFERHGEDWVQVARLITFDGFEYDSLGGSLDVSGDRIVAGALNDDDGGKSSGAAYVFEKLGPVWLQTAKLVAPDADEFARFGTSVAIDGDVVLVGTVGDDDGAASSGAAYFYQRTPNGWTYAGKLVSAEPSELAYFGTSVELAGDTALVGETGHDEAGSNAGAVHVYRRTEAGGWERVQKLLPTAPAFLGRFGSSARLDGEQLLVGAPGEDGAAATSGAAYLYERRDGGFELTGRLVASESAGNALFGSYLDVDGDDLAVGAPFESDVEEHSGAVYVFEVEALTAPFCFCASESPCGNVDADGGCMNSTLSGARLTTSGSTSVAADDLVVRVSDVPRDQYGIVFMGGGQTSLPMGDGVRCVDWGNVGMFRFPLRNAAASGVIVEGPELAAHSAAHFGDMGAVAAGQTWYLQALFRDDRGACGVGVNLSNAVAVTFVP